MCMPEYHERRMPMLYLWFSLGDSIRADYLCSLFIIFPNVYDHALPHRTCGICFLTRASSVKVLSPNHWTTREFPLSLKLEQKNLVSRSDPKESFIPSFKIFFSVKANVCFCHRKHSRALFFSRSRVDTVYVILQLPVEA